MNNTTDNRNQNQAPTQRGSGVDLQRLVLPDLSDDELEKHCHDLACFMDEHDRDGFTSASLTTCFRVLVKAGLTTERELREIQMEEMISRQNTEVRLGGSDDTE